MYRNSRYVHQDDLAALEKNFDEVGMNISVRISVLLCKLFSNFFVTRLKLE